jgi:hypothetical protein
MDDAHNHDTRFYADHSVPAFVLDYLKSRGAEVFPPENPKEGQKKKALFHSKQAQKRQALLLTTSLNYLNFSWHPRKVSKYNTIVLRPVQNEIPPSFGEIVYSFISKILKPKKKIWPRVIVEISDQIFVYDPLGNKYVYDVKRLQNGEYSFETSFISLDDKSSFIGALAAKARKWGHITYDDIYAIIPDHKVTADLVDEIATTLGKMGIKVTDGEEDQEKSPRLRQVDQELLDYERHVASTLKELFSGAHGDDVEILKSESPENRGSETETDQPAGLVSAKVPMPNILQMADVTPGLSEASAINLSREKEKPARTVPSRNKRIRDAEVESLLSEATRNGQSEFTSIPKVYDNPKFSNDRRLSLYAGIVGRRAEEIVIKLLQETLTEEERQSIRWISRMGETPGWDIDYVASDGQTIGIEVKGTTGKSFPNVEITSNEWDAACELQDRYWLYLVTSCVTDTPKVQRINNPSELNNKGEIKVTPLLWKLERILAGQSEE